MSESFIFNLESFEIENTRSRHTDTVYVSCTLAVGSGAPQSQTKGMGDLNNGRYAVGLSFGPVTVASNEAAIFNYLILNSGHQSQQATQDALTKAGEFLAKKGADAAAQAIASGVGSLVGASIGSAVLPVIGTALGALAGWIVGELGGIIFANCDGPVAAEQVAMTGAELTANTASGKPYSHTTFHPGTDSPHGCGSNSKYKVTWAIRRLLPTEPNPQPGVKYHIQSHMSGLFLDVRGAEVKDNGDICQAVVDGKQTWEIIPSEKYPGYYHIRTGLAPDSPFRFLDVYGANKDDGGRICLARQNPEQVWKLIPSETPGYFYIQTRISNYFLDVFGANQDVGGRICQALHQNRGQVWGFVPAS